MKRRGFDCPRGGLGAVQSRPQSEVERSALELAGERHRGELSLAVFGGVVF